ncbi:TPA: hypothetical protein NID16_005279 [Pseudomonas aeruginosa]|nr:hypothetical protein [Pseudomonas aeruginosa]
MGITDPEFVFAGPATQPSGLVALCEQGIVSSLSRYLAEDVDVGGVHLVRTIAIVSLDLGTAGAFPIVMIDHHDDDDEAMRFSVAVFSALKNQGKASSEQVARWRRALFAVVPNSQH